MRVNGRTEGHRYAMNLGAIDRVRLTLVGGQVRSGASNTRPDRYYDALTGNGVQP